VGWLGQLTGTGEVTWNRYFTPAEPDDPRGPGRMGG
jgi:hypothetical protein